MLAGIKPENRLSKLLWKSTRTSSNASFDILATVQSSPEPETIIPPAGAQPNSADAQSHSAPSSLRRSERVKTPTEKGASLAQEFQEFKKGSAKAICGRLRCARKLAGSVSVPSDGNGYQSTSTMDCSVKSLPPMPIVTPCPRVGDRPGPHKAAARGSDEGAAARTARRNSQSPSRVPGTPGQDSGSKYYDIIEGINTTRQESQHHHLVEGNDTAPQESQHFVLATNSPTWT
ncbi:hypothetical protein FRC07_014603 [Ceratobasidium sp. 392]|nr:hypothetical protein FRC07_014603 [Ceratobasidium sp. 392]